jgi:hypothetical protein
LTPRFICIGTSRDPCFMAVFIPSYEPLINVV